MGRNALRLRRAQVRLERQRRRADRLVPHAPRRLQMPTLRGVRRNSENLDRQAAEIQAARRGEGGLKRECPAGGRAKQKTLLSRPRRGRAATFFGTWN